MDRFVQDLHELLLDRKAEDVTLLGHSYGGTLALEYVLAHPQGVRQIILENGFVDAPMSMEDRIGDAAATCKQKDIPEIEAITQKYAEGQQLSFNELKRLVKGDLEPHYWYDPSMRAQIVEGGYERWGYTQENGSLNWALCEKFWDQGLFTSYSFFTRLEEIMKPVLVLTGRHDRVISPRHAEETARRLPRSQLAIFEKSGHFPHIEEPEAFRQLIYTFVEQGVE
jgi:proline iminopeptidase